MDLIANRSQSSQLHHTRSRPALSGMTAFASALPPRSLNFSRGNLELHTAGTAERLGATGLASGTQATRRSVLRPATYCSDASSLEITAALQSQVNLTA
jgi:hypothetical protein